MTNLFKSIKNKRIYELDLIRGIAVIFMMFDHFMYDIFGLMPLIFSDFPKKDGLSMDIYKLCGDYWNMDLRTFVRYIIVFVFMALVGVCATFSKNNIKRGLKLGLVSLILSILSYIVSLVLEDPTYFITFGTLHCISLSLLLVGVMLKYIKNRWVYFSIGLLMIILGAYFEYNVQYVVETSDPLYFIVLKQFIGLIEFGGDTMPFLLSGGQVLIGVFIGLTYYKKRESLINKEYQNNVITFVGRNALVVYFAHQLIIPFTLMILLMVFGFTFAV